MTGAWVLAFTIFGLENKKIIEVINLSTREASAVRICYITIILASMTLKNLVPSTLTRKNLHKTVLHNVV